METSAYRTEEWHPGALTLVFWNIVSLGLGILGIFLFFIIYVITSFYSELSGLEQTLSYPGVMWAVFSSLAILVVLLCAHEWIHGLTIRLFGGHPTYGVGTMYRVFPYLYCTAAGYRFSRWQFATISVAPLVAITAVGAFCIALPYGGWLVVPLSIHLSFCVADIWFLGVIFRQPRNTLFEDLRIGVRLHHRVR